MSQTAFDLVRLMFPTHEGISMKFGVSNSRMEYVESAECGLLTIPTQSLTAVLS